MNTQPWIQQGLNPSVLYGIAHDGYWGYEHYKYIQEDWIAEVRNQDTMQSYHQWVTTRIEQESENENSG